MDELFLTTQPAHLQRQFSDKLSAEERDLHPRGHAAGPLEKRQPAGCQTGRRRFATGQNLRRIATGFILRLLCGHSDFPASILLSCPNSTGQFGQSLALYERIMSDEAMSNFTPRAQQVLALARKEADRFNHNVIGTEHLLLGLIKLGQGVAVNVLQKMGLDLETVRWTSRNRRHRSRPEDDRQHSLHAAREEGSRPGEARGQESEPHLHRHGTHPARPAARGRWRGGAHPAGASTWTSSRRGRKF